MPRVVGTFQGVLGRYSPKWLPASMFCEHRIWIPINISNQTGYKIMTAVKMYGSSTFPDR